MNPRTRNERREVVCETANGNIRAAMGIPASTRQSRADGITRISGRRKVRPDEEAERDREVFRPSAGRRRDEGERMTETAPVEPGGAADGAFAARIKRIFIFTEQTYCFCAGATLPYLPPFFASPGKVILFPSQGNDDGANASHEGENPHRDLIRKIDHQTSFCGRSSDYSTAGFRFQRDFGKKFGMMI